MEHKPLTISNRKNIVISSLAVTLAAQVNVTLSISFFKLSIGIVLFTVLLFLTENFSIIPVTLLSGIGVYISRIIVGCLQYGFSSVLPGDYFPEFLFYLSYGFLFYFYYKIVHGRLVINGALLPLFFMDYCANLVELLCRVQSQIFLPQTQFSILLAALIRTALIWLIITAVDHYGFTIIKKEHAKRYQNLLLLISKLQGEVVWMQKNTNQIEQTMSESYALYNQMQQQHISEDLSKSALSVAKDIHEIKKEYTLIMRGISSALEQNSRETGMYLSEILDVLSESLHAEYSSSGKVLHIESQYDTDFYTNQQYLFLSILRNLFTNAIEATDGDIVTIQISQEVTGQSCLLSVRDFGRGISPQYLPQIFEAGFSTKINYETGEINRGLGLNLVKDIIEEKLKGSICVQSNNDGTTFMLRIPATVFEASGQKEVTL